MANTEDDWQAEGINGEVAIIETNAAPRNYFRQALIGLNLNVTYGVD